MPKTLDQALEELKQLPEDAQEAIAHDLLELIRSEVKWDQLFDDPRSDALMDQMAAKVRAEIVAGAAIDGDPSDQDVER